MGRGTQDRQVGAREGEDLLALCVDTEVDLVLHTGHGRDLDVLDHKEHLVRALEGCRKREHSPQVRRGVDTLVVEGALTDCVLEVGVGDQGRHGERGAVVRGVRVVDVEAVGDGSVHLVLRLVHDADDLLEAVVAVTRDLLDELSGVE